jgi:hypothetical protein
MLSAVQQSAFDERSDPNFNERPFRIQICFILQVRGGGVFIGKDDVAVQIKEPQRLALALHASQFGTAQSRSRQNTESKQTKCKETVNKNEHQATWRTRDSERAAVCIGFECRAAAAAAAVGIDSC